MIRLDQWTGREPTGREKWLIGAVMFDVIFFLVLLVAWLASVLR